MGGNIDQIDTGENILINTAFLGVFAAWAIVSNSAELQPMTFALGVAFVRFFMKIGSLGRVPTKSNSDEAKRQLLMRFIRAFSFTISCVFISIVLYTLVPNAIGKLFGVGIPLWFFFKQVGLANGDAPKKKRHEGGNPVNAMT